jgi:prephenate dehydrogenase
VAGLGLIGGSLALALRRAGHQVIGVDRAAVLRRARAAGALTGTARTVSGAATAADLVVLAAPPDVNLRLLEELAVGAPEARVTDVTSVKQPIVRLARRLRLRGFVGGHPMAGREQGGFGGADAQLFQGRPWILTPERTTDPAAVRAAERLARAVGARVVHRKAAEHDRAVARVSHLPQLVAWALADAAAGHQDLAGPAYREMTRLAASPPGLWAQILDQNAAEVEAAVRAFVRALRAHGRRGRR